MLPYEYAYYFKLYRILNKPLKVYYGVETRKLWKCSQNFDQQTKVRTHSNVEFWCYENIKSFNNNKEINTTATRLRPQHRRTDNEAKWQTKYTNMLKPDVATMKLMVYAIDFCTSFAWPKLTVGATFYTSVT